MIKVPPLRLIAMEVTRTCHLACKHCRGDSHNQSYENELSLDEIKAILDNTNSFAKPIIIITGGEPLTRPDVFEIASYSSSLGFRTVLATCGHLLTDETVKKLIDSGVSRISVSIDGANAERHDGFRGIPGAYEAALKGLENARKQSLDFQINSTLTTLNVDDLEVIHDLAVDLGAVGFHPFLLVPMGRGQALSEIALSPEEYENTLIKIAGIASKSPIEIKPTCSPHYTRVTKQLAKDSSAGDMKHPETAPVAQGHPMSPHGHSGHRHTMTKGCLGGQGFIFVSHVGKVQMCGFLETEAGDLRANDNNLSDIWDNSEFFRKIRDIDNYHGKCGYCEYRQICGGCRARAHYMTDDYLGEEPNCIYTPKRMSK